MSDTCVPKQRQGFPKNTIPRGLSINVIIQNTITRCRHNSSLNYITNTSLKSTFLCQFMTTCTITPEQAAGSVKGHHVYTCTYVHLHVGRCTSLQCETFHMLPCPQLQPSVSVFIKCM